LEKLEAKGLVFNIQKYSVHDGPGIRTMVFLKGCPLRCPWCSNPESQNPWPEIAFDPKLCLGLSKCRYCLSACPEGGIKAGPPGLRDPQGLQGLPLVDRDKCRECRSQACRDICPTRALFLYGEEKSPSQILSDRKSVV
jgi:pyruvate formate lyase activating enzyme